jgi:hypothetical protein
MTDYFSEERARHYQVSNSLILEDVTIFKKWRQARRIHRIADDDSLRLVLPPGLPVEYYTQGFHKLQMRDMYLQLLEHARDGLHGNAFGCGAGKTNRDAFLRAISGVAENFNIFGRGDFTDFYNCIDLDRLGQVLDTYLHDQPELKECLIRIQKLPRHCLTFGEIEMATQGVLQGLSPANLLANLYLLDFDVFCSTLSPYYTRFGDDFCVAYRNAQEAGEAGQQIREYLREHYPSLKLHPNKTNDIVLLSKLEFVGYKFKPGTNDISLSDLPKLMLLDRYRAMVKKWKRHRNINEFAHQIQRDLGSTRVQLSIVQDMECIEQCWDAIYKMVKDTFRTIYPLPIERKLALHRLGIPMSQCGQLVNGKHSADPLEPFSARNLSEILIDVLSNNRKEVKNVDVKLKHFAFLS